MSGWGVSESMDVHGCVRTPLTASLGRRSRPAWRNQGPRMACAPAGPGDTQAEPPNTVQKEEDKGRGQRIRSYFLVV